ILAVVDTWLTNASQIASDLREEITLVRVALVRSLDEMIVDALGALVEPMKKIRAQASPCREQRMKDCAQLVALGQGKIIALDEMLEGRDEIGVEWALFGESAKELDVERRKVGDAEKMNRRLGRF